MTRKVLAITCGILSLAGLTLLARKSAERHRVEQDLALVQAVSDGDLKQSGALLQAGANVQTRTPQGESLLFAADASQNPELVIALVRRGVSLHERDRMGLTVLHRAARRGDVEMLDMLLQLGQSVDELDGHGRTALNHALRGPHFEAAHFLLAQGAKVRLPPPSEPPLLSLLSADLLMKSRSGSPWGMSLLTWGGMGSAGAVSKRTTPPPPDPLARYRRRPGPTIREEAPLLNCVRELLSDGAEPDARDATGSSPIEVAISRGLWKTTRLLVEKHGRWRDGQGRTALRIAAELGSDEGIAELYRTRGRPTEGAQAELLLAAWAGDNQRVSNLLSQRIDPSGISIPGRTALGRASARGDLKSVEALLAAGARPAQTEEGDHTPLHIAAEYRRPAIVLALLSAGAPVNARSKTGRAPLHEAAKWAFRSPEATRPVEDRQEGANQLQAVTILLEHGADPNARDDRGATPLQNAIPRLGPGNPEVIERLLAHGSDSSGHGTSEGPLFAAAQNGDIPLARALLDHGAQVNERKQDDGSTPLWRAANQNEHAMMRFLCSRGAALPETVRVPSGPGTSKTTSMRVVDVIRKWPPTDERRRILAHQFPALAAELSQTGAKFAE